MKKVFLFLMALICALTVFAQQKGDLNLNDPIKADPNVTIGKLDNGMTYYIRNRARQQAPEPPHGEFQVGERNQGGF